MRRILFAMGISLLCTSAQAETTWGQKLEDDVRAFHSIIMDSHPGPVDSLNPDFTLKAEAALEVALNRSKIVDTRAGWWWALVGYQASFDDGHVAFTLPDEGFELSHVWPGFLTVWRADDQFVAVTDPQLEVLPPVGAKLTGCDGVEAQTLAQERVGYFNGRWFLASQRVKFGDLLFVISENPFLKPLRACTFAQEGREVTYALNWTPLSDEELKAYRAIATPKSHYDFGIAIEDRLVWIAMPSFDVSSQSYAHQQLITIIDTLKADQAQVRDTDIIVLDLRGNGGGSSLWSRDIANVIWGNDWVNTHEAKGSEVVDWRASQGNLAQIESYEKEFRKNGSNAEIVAMLESIVTGLRAARARGEALWRQVSEDEPSAQLQAEAANPVSGKVFVLTDHLCASACLDAVDLWTSLGAVQVGQETSADTLYMEVRPQTLPSGRGDVVVPMKVYRGRPRGNNETHRPEHSFEGNMTDTQALKAWIRTL